VTHDHMQWRCVTSGYISETVFSVIVLRFRSREVFCAIFCVNVSDFVSAFMYMRGYN
jgi:hypothetical protein